MYVEFTQDSPLNPAWKKGAHLDLPEYAARSEIGAGFARESSATQYFQSTMATGLDSFKAEVRTMITDAVRGAAPSQGPPGRANYTEQGVADQARGADVVTGVDTRHHEAPADRGAKCLTDIMRCTFMYGATGIEPAMRDFADKRLRSVYGLGKVDYGMDESTGRMFRIEKDGKTGEVYRTGTESLSGPSYGFLVKPEYTTTLFKIMMEDSIIADYAWSVPIGQGVELKWPSLDQFGAPVAGQSSSYAGVQLYRTTEIQQRIASDAKTSMIDFKVTDLTGFSSVSRDLLQDNFIAADALLQTVFGMAFNWKTDYEYFNGSGKGEPTGIFNCQATIAGGGVAGNATRATANHIVYEDLAWMQSVLYSPAYRNAYWVMHASCLPELQRIKDAAGTVVYQPNALVGQGMTPTIMGSDMVTGGVRNIGINADRYRFQGWLQGLPVKISEKVPTLGNKGDLSLIAPGAGYGIAMKQGLEVGLSEHFYFDTDRIAFRFKLRNDAQSLWRDKYTQADGVWKTSPFVVLN